MVLDTSPGKLADEIRSAEEWRDELLMHFEAAVERYHGPYFKSQRGFLNADNPENHAYEWLSLVVPQMVFGNPRVKVGTKRIGSQRDDARAIESGLNRWIRDTNMRRVNEKLAVDFSFNFSVGIVTREPRPGLHEQEDPVMWPQVKRLSQKRFIFDPLAIEQEDWRWMGHMVIRDKDDLVQEAKDNPDSGWNAEALKRLTPDAKVDEGRPRDRAHRNVRREEVAYYEIWVPEISNEDEGEDFTPKNGYHGKIFTVAINGTDDAAYIRDPQPYWGPRWGPYFFMGAYTVPDESAPLSPLTATESQSEDLNNHARAIAVAAARFKKVLLVNADDPDLAEKIASTKDGFVVLVDDFDRAKAAEATFGGPDQVQMAYQEVARDRLHRVSGLDDAQRGSVTGDATATENAIADRASNTRIGFLVQKFRDGVQQALKTVAWYLYHDDEIRFPLGDEASDTFVHPDTGQPLKDPVFQGGFNMEESAGPTFDDLELEIEPYSMARTSEAMVQRKMLEISNIVLNTAPLIPQTPWVDWKGYYEKIGEMANIPGLGELIDVDTAIAYGQMMMQMEMEAAEQSDTSTQPMLNRQMASGGRKGGSQGARPRAAQNQGMGRLNGSGGAGGNIAPGVGREGYSTGADLGVPQR